MEWGAALSTLAAIVLLLLREYVSRKPQHIEEQNNDKVQEERQDIADADVSAVNDRIDKLLSQASDNSSKPTGSEVTAERINSI